MWTWVYIYIYPYIHTDAENTDEHVYDTVALQDVRNPPRIDMAQNEAYIETLPVKVNVAYSTVKSPQMTEEYDYIY